jgi:hypothetical protein
MDIKPSDFPHCVNTFPDAGMLAHCMVLPLQPIKKDLHEKGNDYVTRISSLCRFGSIFQRHH